MGLMETNENQLKSDPQIRPGFELNTSALHIFHRIGQYASDMHAKELGRGGLTQRQFAILSVLSKIGAASQVQLVKETGIDRSTLAEILARMEKSGVILRQKSATDNRANVVELSAEGKTVFADNLPKFVKIDQKIISTLGESKGRKLLELANGLMEKMFPSQETVQEAAITISKKSQEKPQKSRKSKKAKKAKKAKK
jgi:DNA-binding MarR family transcriptional regulator